MFIRTVYKRNKPTSTKYEYQQLVESVRTERGVRQKLLLSLGRLPIAKERWPSLAKRIESIVQGQATFIKPEPEVEKLAQKFARQFIEKHTVVHESKYEKVDIKSLRNHRVRRIGGEYLGTTFFKKLHLHQCLKACGFSKRQIEIAMLLVIGRLVHPGSERHLFRWAQHFSGLDELVHTDFSHLSLNSLYKVTDLLYAQKDEIEAHLRSRENNLFSLNETIILYDLTNTYFEGQAALNSKARFGRSKEKRSDCRLLTLGLVLDGDGFPKTSKVFSGNQSEPATLLEMVNKLCQKDPTNNQKPTVVIDAGIATEENLKELKKHYHYIAVSRKKLNPPPETDDCLVIKENGQNRVEVKRMVGDDEILLYCQSSLKRKKEQSMQSRLEQSFEEQLIRLSKSIHKKGCTKRWDKVLQRIGRLQEKYKQIARFYQIDVEERDGLASRISWSYLKEQSDERFSGAYFLRTDRFDLSEKELWAIYVMLTQVEDAFRILKSDLLMRPVFHQTENRSDAHIFITVLAYHLLHSIRTALRQSDVKMSWQQIRDRMATHCRVTNRIKTEQGDVLFIRKCSEPEDFHKTIYEALRIDHVPCQTKQYMIKICSDP